MIDPWKLLELALFFCSSAIVAYAAVIAAVILGGMQ